MKTKPRLSHFKAVIFDLDGLVLDTESTYFAAWQQAAAKMAYRLSDEFCISLSGLEYQEVTRRIQACCGDQFDPQQFNRLSAIYWREHVTSHGISVKKGFFELLRIVREKHLPFCLATNSLRKNALECLRYAGLDNVFPVLVGRDSVAAGKPAPDIFYRAASLLNHPLSTCLILEDSTAGIVAARRTEAQVVFIPSVAPADTDTIGMADIVFEDLLQLAEFVRLSVFDPV